MWSTAAGEGDHERLQELGFYSLLWLAQALGRRRAGRAARIVVVASQLHRVTGDESLAPAKATLLGPCRVIPQELAGVSCVSVDVEPAAAAAPSSEAADRLAGWLLAEAPRSVEPDGATLVAYRGGAEARRFVQDFAPVRPDAAADRNAAPRLRDGGVYLLTGGLGGIGLALAEHLARTLRGPRLVLTGRAPLPPPEEWDAWLASHPPGDRVSGRLRRLRRIEELGAQVMAVAADAAEIEPMREVVAAARRRFGAVHGVVHLAGVPGGGIIQLKTRAAAARIMAPKVAGARVLDALFPHAGDLEVLVLFSSIAAILGEIGQADYCGANAYLDAVAQRNAMRGWPATVTVDSDIWRQVGLATETAVPAHLEAWRAEMLAQALTPEEGADAVIRALACGVPQVVISAQPLAGRIELGRSFTAERFLAEMGAPPTPGRRVMGTRFAGASGSIERRIAAIWQRLLGVEQVGVHDNFFDLGGNSLLGLQVVSEVGRELGAQVAPVTLFESPTVAALARHIAREMGADAPAVPPASPTMAGNAAAGGRDIAIVAMAGRFPGAGSVEELWGNLRAGVESVRFFTDEELAAAGVDPALAADPRYVRAGAVLDGIDLFDAGLFGFSPREAEITDPQHRVFLECAWEALERAGCDPATFPGAIGVFAGANLSTYLLRMVTDPGARASVNLLQAILGNDKDSLTTTVSYRLGLRGPSLAVQTFCSTSLVAVHLACRSLRGGECDMALAGGVRIVVPDRQGYLYEHGGLAPADGHSRSFDARANGSVLGHGAAVVCLKRLADALADGDTVLAVIKGSAINNDGAEKAGFTAPSVNGQAAAIAAAFADAGVEPESVSYVEAHGSATELGDPIEVAALTKAFRRFTPRSAWCPIGSVKSNFGHLDRAAGVTGLIKTVLALEHEELPPSINFERPNPQIDFAASPFFVNAELRPWSRGETPRRASVNSLGIGGTNVHVVVEEAPLPVPGTPSRPWQLLLLSAKTPAALDAVTGRLRGWLEERPEIDPLTFADAAYTLKVGRRALPWRRALVCRDAAEAAAALAAGDPQRLLAGDGGEREPAVVFAFAGLGGQYVDMGRGLYDSEPVFRATVDECAAALAPRLGLDLRQRLYPAAPGGDKDAERGGAERPALDLRRMLAGRNGDDERSEAERLLDETRLAQPALFVVELALARLLASWGIRPQVVLGYSLGEITAACVAGVLALPDALALTAERARRIAELPAGAMLAVGLPADELLALLGPDLSLAAINGPEQSVAAGAPDAVAALAARLDERGVAHRSLRTTHAFHSRQMEALFDGTVELLAGIDLHPPAIPMLSNVTGTWLTADEATDPAYWARHMCQPVRFSDSIAELCAEPDRLVVEIGPGKALGSLILQHPASRSGHEPPIVAPLRHSYETRFAGADQAYALEALGRLWLLGVRPDWKGFHAGERRRRRQLPTYPFERQRYWVETGGAAHLQGAEASPAGGALGGGGAAGSVEPGAALYLPSWRRLPLAAAQSAGAAVSLDTLWLLLADDRGLGQQLATRLTAAGQRVVCARRAAARIEGDLQEVAPGVFEIAPGAAAFAALLGALPGPPAEIVHLWGLDSEDTPESTARELAAIQALAEALAGAPRSFWLVTRQAQAIESGETPRPAAAALAGAGGLVASRLPGCAWRVVDVATPPAGSAGTAAERRLIAQLAAELTSGAAEPLVAYRGAHRWVSGVEPLVLPSAAAAPPRAAAGACLLSGGLGVEGFPVAAWLARRTGARLVLLENAGFPPREEWQERLTGAGTRGDESVAARIRRALRLEELGAELLIGSAEPSDAVAVGALVAQAEARWGALTGIVHVAERQSDATLGLATGMQTLLALDAVRRRSGARLAWLVMPPAAGIPLRLFADALAEASADDEHDGAPGGSGWTSLTWGLDASAEPDGHLEPAGSVLDRLRASDETGPVVLVSPLPLPQGWNRLGELPAAAAAGAAAPPPRAAGVGLYPRPGLRVAYAPPRDEMERVVAGFWEELLGVAQVGIHDNFLDLGGDSLLATRLVARLRDALEVELPVRLLFERSTVAELAAAVAERRGEQVSAETDELVESIRGLSESEIEAEIVRLESIMANEEMLNG